MCLEIGGGHYNILHFYDVSVLSDAMMQLLKDVDSLNKMSAKDNIIHSVVIVMPGLHARLKTLLLCSHFA